MTTRLSVIVIATVAALSSACGGAEQGRSSTSGGGSASGATIADGEALIEQKDYKGAAELFERITAESPGNAKAHYYFGVAKKNLGEVDAAITHYEKAIDIDDKLMDAHINLGLLLLEKGDLKQAESELALYLAASPDAADAHFNYGMVEEAMGHLDKAEASYNKAAELNPEDASPLFGLGDLERRRGKPEAAVELYERARGVDPNVPELLFVEGETLLGMKEVKRACEVLSGLLDMPSVDLVIVVEAGKLMAKHDTTCAGKLYNGAIQADETFATAHFLLANTLARDKKFQEATSHYERFLALSPDDPAATEAQKRLEACKAALSK